MRRIHRPRPHATRVLGLAIGLALLAAACGDASNVDETVRDDLGTVQEGGDVGVFRIRVGDCLDAEVQEEQQSVPVVPCEEPHRSEVYASFDLDEGPYPGPLTVEEQSGDGCLARFEPTFGEPYETSPYFISILFPSEDGWKEIDDREVLCLAYGTELLTGSIVP